MSTETPLDLKKTVNLPKTPFSQKANLAQAEPARLKKWEELDLYRLIREARAGAEKFIMHDGLPYAGSSAGAAVAARRAVVGGYLAGERVVCPEDAAEDLDQVTVVPGIGLVDRMVDVHASSWGTLPRLAAALSMTPDVEGGIALDEDTAWHMTDEEPRVIGRNAVHLLERDTQALRWTVLSAEE